MSGRAGRAVYKGRSDGRWRDARRSRWHVRPSPPARGHFAAVLRHGKAVASEGGVALLARLLPLLRCAFPRARFLGLFAGGGEILR